MTCRQPLSHGGSLLRLEQLVLLLGSLADALVRDPRRRRAFFETLVVAGRGGRCYRHGRSLIGIASATFLIATALGTRRALGVDSTLLRQPALHVDLAAALA